MAPTASAMEEKTLDQSVCRCQDIAVSRGPAKPVGPEQALRKAMTEFRAKGCVGSDLNELLEAMGLRRKSLCGTVGQRA